MRRKTIVFLAVVCGAFVVIAARAAAPSASAMSSAAEPARVFIAHSDSWELSGANGGEAGNFGGEGEGGARPQTAEIIKTFNQRCPDIITNNIEARADYVVVLEHEGGKGYLRHRNKLAVFTRATGDSVTSQSTFSLGAAVEDACRAIRKDWAKNSSAIRAAEAAESARKGGFSGAQLQPASQSSITKLSVTSTPPGADIVVDGGFVGQTPSVLDLPSGEHTLTVSKNGYKNWERKLKAQGGNVKLTLELEAQAN